MANVDQVLREVLDDGDEDDFDAKELYPETGLRPSKVKAELLRQLRAEAVDIYHATDYRVEFDIIWTWHAQESPSVDKIRDVFRSLGVNESDIKSIEIHTAFQAATVMVPLSLVHIGESLEDEDDFDMKDLDVEDPWTFVSYDASRPGEPLVTLYVKWKGREKGSFSSISPDKARNIETNLRTLDRIWPYSGLVRDVHEWWQLYSSARLHPDLPDYPTEDPPTRLGESEEPEEDDDFDMKDLDLEDPWKFYRFSDSRVMGDNPYMVRVHWKGREVGVFRGMTIEEAKNIERNIRRLDEIYPYSTAYPDVHDWWNKYLTSHAKGVPDYPENEPLGEAEEPEEDDFDFKDLTRTDLPTYAFFKSGENSVYGNWPYSGDYLVYSDNPDGGSPQGKTREFEGYVRKLDSTRKWVAILEPVPGDTPEPEVGDPDWSRLPESFEQPFRNEKWSDQFETVEQAIEALMVYNRSRPSGPVRESEDEDDFDMKDLEIHEWEVDRLAGTEVADRLFKAGLKFHIDPVLEQRVAESDGFSQAVSLGNMGFVIDKRLHHSLLKKTMASMWTVIDYLPEYGDYYTEWRDRLQQIVGPENKLWLHNHGLAEIQIPFDDNTPKEMVERLMVAISESKPIGRARLEKVYGKLFQQADAMLKKHQPCDVKAGPGGVTCRGTRDPDYKGMVKPNDLCCGGCKHHGQKGCQTELPTTCKGWLCGPARKAAPEAGKRLDTINRRLVQAKLYAPRQGKEAAVQQALGSWDRIKNPPRYSYEDALRRFGPQPERMTDEWFDWKNQMDAWMAKGRMRESLEDEDDFDFKDLTLSGEAPAEGVIAGGHHQESYCDELRPTLEGYGLVNVIVSPPETVEYPDWDVVFDAPGWFVETYGREVSAESAMSCMVKAVNALFREQMLVKFIPNGSQNHDFVFKLKPVDQPVEESRVHWAATRHIPTGRIGKHFTHWDATDDLLRQGVIPGVNSLHDLEDMEDQNKATEFLQQLEDGWILDDGSFVDRDAGEKVIVDAGQIPPGEREAIDACEVDFRDPDEIDEKWVQQAVEALLREDDEDDFDFKDVAGPVPKHYRVNYWVTSRRRNLKHLNGSKQFTVHFCASPEEAAARFEKFFARDDRPVTRTITGIEPVNESEDDDFDMKDLDIQPVRDLLYDVNWTYEGTSALHHSHMFKSLEEAQAYAADLIISAAPNGFSELYIEEFDFDLNGGSSFQKWFKRYWLDHEGEVTDVQERGQPNPNDLDEAAVAPSQQTVEEYVDKIDAVVKQADKDAFKAVGDRHLFSRRPSEPGHVEKVAQWDAAWKQSVENQSTDRLVFTVAQPGGHAGFYRSRTDQVVINLPLSYPYNRAGMSGSYRSVIAHELVHREQFGRMPPAARSLGSRISGYRQSSKKGQVPTRKERDRYLQAPNELMARAYEVVLSLYRRWASRESVLGVLRRVGANLDHSPFNFLIKQVDPKARNLFLKYCYQYAQELPDENRVQQAVEALINEDEDDDFDIKDLTGAETHTERWCFTEEELKHPYECKSDDTFIANLGSDDEGPVAELGVVVQRNGTVTDEWSDGTRGVREEYQQIADSVEYLQKAFPENQEDSVTIAWRDVVADQDGKFVSWHPLGEGLEDDDDFDMKDLDLVEPSEWAIAGLNRMGFNVYYRGGGTPWAYSSNEAKLFPRSAALEKLDSLRAKYPKVSHRGIVRVAKVRRVGEAEEEEDDFDMKDVAGEPVEPLPKVPRSRVKFLLWCEPEEDISFRREFRDQPEVVQWISDQLDEGNEWAWCSAHVIASWIAPDGKEYTGDAWLGGCSYRSEWDFKRGGYLPQMRDDAYDDLVQNVKQGLGESLEDDDFDMKDLDLDQKIDWVVAKPSSFGVIWRYLFDAESQWSQNIDLATRYTRADAEAVAERMRSIGFEAVAMQLDHYPVDEGWLQGKVDQMRGLVSRDEYGMGRNTEKGWKPRYGSQVAGKRPPAKRKPRQDPESKTWTVEDKPDRQTRKYKVTARPDHLDKIEQLFAWMDSTRSGHSGEAAISIDGDGAARVKIEKEGGDLVEPDEKTKQPTHSGRGPEFKVCLEDLEDEDDFDMKDLDVRQPHDVVIEAHIVDEDSGDRLDFNAAPWFLQASRDKVLAAFRGHGTDVIAQDLALEDEALDTFFGRLSGLGGYNVWFDGLEAQEVLQQYRPDIWRKLQPVSETLKQPAADLPDDLKGDMTPPMTWTAFTRPPKKTAGGKTYSHGMVEFMSQVKQEDQAMFTEAMVRLRKYYLDGMAVRVPQNATWALKMPGGYVVYGKNYEGRLEGISVGGVGENINSEYIVENPTMTDLENRQWDRVRKGL